MTYCTRIVTVFVAFFQKFLLSFILPAHRSFIDMFIHLFHATFQHHNCFDYGPQIRIRIQACGFIYVFNIEMQMMHNRIITMSPNITHSTFEQCCRCQFGQSIFNNFTFQIVWVSQRANECVCVYVCSIQFSEQFDLSEMWWLIGLEINFLIA